MHAVIILATVHIVIMGDLHVLWYTIDELELCKGSFCLKVRMSDFSLHVWTLQPKQTDYLGLLSYCVNEMATEDHH